MDKINLQNIRNRIHKLTIWNRLFLGLLACFAFTRLWQLTTLPAGLHIDEAGMAYDAWSLSQYGVDRYLKSWPVYLTNFGSGQSSLYAFLCAVFFRIFGYSVWFVRMPAVLFSLLTLVFGVLVAGKLFPQNRYLPLAVGALVTFCPYFIMAGRFGLDCNLMLGMSAVFLYLLLHAVDTGRVRYYILAGLAGGLLLYTYALTYIVVPVFLLLFLGYVLWTRRFSLRGWLLMALPLGILAAPLILVQCVNFFDLEEMKIGIFTITKLDSYRASEIGNGSLEKLGLALRSIFIGDEFNYNSVPEFKNMYFITFPLFCVGLCSILWKWLRSLKLRSFSPAAVVLFWLVSMLLLGAHIESNVNKMNGAFLAVLLIAAEGIRVLLQRGGRALRGIAVCAGGLYVAGFIGFGFYYYGGEYAQTNNPLDYFDITVPEAVDYVEDNKKLDQRVTYMAQQGIYYALSTLISPYEWRYFDQQDNRFGNFVFGGLGPIEKNCNYIVSNKFKEYGDSLRAAGFQEIRHESYSLFYRK